MKKNIWWL